MLEQHRSVTIQRVRQHGGLELLKHLGSEGLIKKRDTHTYIHTCIHTYKLQTEATEKQKMLPTARRKGDASSKQPNSRQKQASERTREREREKTETERQRDRETERERDPRVDAVQLHSANIRIPAAVEYLLHTTKHHGRCLVVVGGGHRQVAQHLHQAHRAAGNLYTAMTEFVGKGQDRSRWGRGGAERNLKGCWKRTGPFPLREGGCREKHEGLLEEHRESVPCTYTVHSTPYTVHRTPYTVHCTPYNTVHTVHTLEYRGGAH
jgi:hypothetical protein